MFIRIKGDEIEFYNSRWVTIKGRRVFIEESYSKYFKTSKTGMFQYDGFLDGSRSIDCNKVFFKKVLMSPDEYIDEVWMGFRKNGWNVTRAELLQTRSDNTLENLRKKFGKTPFDMPMIVYQTDEVGDVTMDSQEGLHRAMLAKEVGLKKIPVVIFNQMHWRSNVSSDLLKSKLQVLTQQYSEIK